MTHEFLTVIVLVFIASWVIEWWNDLGVPSLSELFKEAREDEYEPPQLVEDEA